MHRFTIGQRKGIDIPSNCDFEHYVVVAKDYATGRLIVGFDHPETKGLYAKKARIWGLNFLEKKPQNSEKLLVKPRYRDTSQKIIWRWHSDLVAEIEFDVPQRALAIGQAIAFYRENVLIGGGIYQLIL